MRDPSQLLSGPTAPADDSSPVGREEWGPGYDLWQAVQGLLAQRGPEGTTSLIRMASHLALILVAVLVLWISRQQLPQVDLVTEAAVSDSAGAESETTLDTGTNPESTDSFALVRAAIPITLIPERPRIEIITHTVTAGDTLYGIATKYKLSAETIVWSNKALETNPDLLRVGQQLVILPVNGVYHTVVKGDTLDKIAKTYKVKTDAIVTYALNKLAPANPQLAAGQKLVVPGGQKVIPLPAAQVYSGPVPAGAKKGTGRFVWPTSGYITQGYKRLHPAIDIARAIGTPVKAADSGYIVVAGWSNQGYGNYVVVNHGNGFQTLYAHLDKILVRVGDVVGQGAQIGTMGSTGRSTGPHLHFEIHKSGSKVNPLSYLR